MLSLLGCLPPSKPPQGLETERKGFLRVCAEEFGWTDLKNNGLGTMNFNTSVHQISNLPRHFMKHGPDT